MAKRKSDAQPGGKSIILFSDGTGNSSAKVFKTNVWRMYEAVDLGPSPTGTRDQISFYDDGVGTSNFKLLAALGGAFGWGLKRNVLDLYCYACRNYRPGDRLYAFGFSRGAFTIRLVVALIASQGLVQSDDESELDRKSREAYRAFRSTFQRRKFKRFTRSAKLIRAKIADATEADDEHAYRPEDNLKPTIRFVGVWDTVAAYGGPIAEITRAIDNWIYPLSMPDYELDEKVQCARHALAIDDERDAFQPLLWDELAEDRRADEACKLAQAAKARAAKTKSARARERHLREVERQEVRETLFRTRLQQVWFTGMHADVGGGYPDESLSYVSLLWMMEEAEKAGLRTLPSIKDRFYALANSYGPMHDSRSGIGAYYRYQPRKIAAWIDSPDDGSRYLMLRDPDIRGEDGKPRGLLRCVCVHESVIARINSGTVRYAPIALPRTFQIVPPQQKGETIKQTGDAAALKCKYDRPPSEPLITPAIRKRVEREAPERFTCQENIWDIVWWRRIAYFATVILTLLLVALPLSNSWLAVDSLCSDSRCWLRSLIRPARALVPAFVDPWIEAMASHPLTAIILALLILGLLKFSGFLERRLWDRSYVLWRGLLDGRALPQCAESGLREAREGPVYQNLFKAIKWSILPAFFGILMLLAILYVPTVALTQLAIQANEADHYFCPSDNPRTLQAVSDRQTIHFDTQQPCSAPGLVIQTNQPYEIVFQLPASPKGDPVPWWDANVPSRAGALTRVPASGFFQVLGVPIRRVIEASYLQPVAHVSESYKAPTAHWYEPAFVRSWRARFARVHVTKLALAPDEDWPELYRVRFVARSERDEPRILHFYPNEAYLPGAGRFFYDNNCGTADVTVIKVVPRRLNAPLPDKMDEPNPRLNPPPCFYDPKRQQILKKLSARAP